MKKISYKKLYDYYIQEEELTLPATLRNIWRVRKLPTVYKEVVANILDGNFSAIADFECEGIKLQQLVEDEEMKPVNAVLFMDWLRREPIEALRFMANGRFRASVQSLDDDEHQLITNALKNIGQNSSEEDTTWQPDPQDSSKQDIAIEDELKNDQKVAVPSKETTPVEIKKQ